MRRFERSPERSSSGLVVGALVVLVLVLVAGAFLVLDRGKAKPADGSAAPIATPEGEPSAWDAHLHPPFAVVARAEADARVKLFRERFPKLAKDEYVLAEGLIRGAALEEVSTITTGPRDTSNLPASMIAESMARGREDALEYASAMVAMGRRNMAEARALKTRGAREGK